MVVFLRFVNTRQRSKEETARFSLVGRFYHSHARLPTYPHARVYSTIVCVFCLHSFTTRSISLWCSALRVKAKGRLPSPKRGALTMFWRIVETLDFERFTQIGEGSEGKMQECSVVCCARVRSAEGMIFLRGSLNYL